MTDRPDREEDTRSEEDRRLSLLMRAAQNGDRAAYTKLLEDVAVRLRRAIRGRNAYLQTADVEDLVQDVLMSLHVARATYQPDRPFIPWLMAIARNRVADGARRYARRGAREVVVDEIPETFSDEPANKNADNLVDSMSLRDAIDSLPPAQREAVRMLKLRQMSLVEASEASGMSVPALKTTVHRAIKRLRKMLTSEA
jgi:RNA polymerase sigma factor (sigma-70 family)